MHVTHIIARIHAETYRIMVSVQFEHFAMANEVGRNELPSVSAGRQLLICASSIPQPLDMCGLEWSVKVRRASVSTLLQ